MAYLQRFGYPKTAWLPCIACIAGAYHLRDIAILHRATHQDIGGAQVSSIFCHGFATMPKINGNEIRPGNVLEHNDGLWAAVKVDHVKPGKGGAFAQVELRNLRNGSKLNERFRSADKVERIRLEQKDQQFLYEADGMLTFMDTETYEQIELSADLLGERRPFLQDGMTIVVEFYETEALNATLPQKVTCKVVETEPVVKGQTAANSFKPAILDNGVKVSVPPFVGQDEDIIVNTETFEYVERA